MTGNIAIDIAIGLIFIYSLYSLLATTIVEFISVSFQLRSRNLKRAITRMLDDEDKGVLAADFNKSPVIKYLSSARFSKLFKVNTYPSYIEPCSFSQALIYVLKNGNKGDEAIQASLEKYSHTETGKHLLFLYNEAKGDITRFTQLVESWFDSTMERSSGWYKKNMTYITLGIALIIAMLFNIDSFKIIGKLSKDSNAREQYVQMAGQAMSSDAFNNSTPVFDSSLKQRLLNDTALFNYLGNDSTALKNAVNDSIGAAISQIQKKTLVRMDSLYIISQQSQNILSFKRTNKPSWVFNSWNNFLGCLVTALALSLGAPFWFDLLNKLMKLRSSISIGKVTECRTPTDTVN
jgi:hypothetical protein